MPREEASAKGRRLLAEGRLRLVRVEGDVIRAECRGDSAVVYLLTHHPAGQWHCSCPALTAFCSHLVALKLVTVVAG